MTAGRLSLEVAHVQYYGWALANRAALLPSREQLDAATAAVSLSTMSFRTIMRIAQRRAWAAGAGVSLM